MEQLAGGGKGKGNGTVKITLTSQTEGKYNINYKFDKIQFDREKELAQKEMKEPSWDDNNMQGSSGLLETDMKEFPEFEGKEVDPMEKDFDKPEKELKEKGGDIEKELQKEKEREKEKE